jgi:acetylornithine aminotransferase
MEKEKLMDNAARVGGYWLQKLKAMPRITGLRGRGLMIGLDLPDEFKHVRSNLLLKHHIFTGEAKPNTVRLLPSLAVTDEEADLLLKALNEELA